MTPPKLDASPKAAKSTSNDDIKKQSLVPLKDFGERLESTPASNVPAIKEGNPQAEAAPAPAPAALVAPHAVTAPPSSPAVDSVKPAEVAPKPARASPKPEVYLIDPNSNELQPVLPQITKVPMAMVHSESPLDSAHTMAHTMKPGDSILTVGVDQFGSNLVLGMGAPQPRPVPNKVTPAVHGATFAAGGVTYTASMDRDLNILVGSSILRPGGAAATLGNGAAVVSVVPGGALMVDGGTLTMSAIHPPVTGAVVNLAGKLLTATQTSGPGGKMMVLGSATMTAGGPAATIFGQVVSFGADGLAVGGLVAPITTMTYSDVSSGGVSQTRVSGFARFSGTMKLNTTSQVASAASHAVGLSWNILFLETLIATTAWFLGFG